MTTPNPQRRLLGLTVFGVALALLLASILLAVSVLRPRSVGEGISSAPPASPSVVESQLASISPSDTSFRVMTQPLPVPDGHTLVAVLDAASTTPTVSAEEAVALARASMGNKVGKAPLVQLVRMDGEDPDWPDGWTGWIILSTDLGWPHPVSPPPAVVYTWVMVSADGEILGAVGNAYDTPDLAPELPAD